MEVQTLMHASRSALTRARIRVSVTITFKRSNHVRNRYEKTMLGQSIKSVIRVFMFSLLFASVSAQNKKEKTAQPAQSITELRQQME
jgi:hypothetical protein